MRAPCRSTGIITAVPVGGGYRWTILKLMRFAEERLRAASVALATRRYLPGASFWPRSRPVNLKLFLPCFPAWVKLPLSAT